MPIPSWPAGFPCLLREGYGYELPELNGRTDFELGARVRPLYQDGNDRFTASAVLTQSQCAVFQAWLRYEASNGALWFTVTLRAAGLLSEREVRLTAPPAFQLFGADRIRVSLPLETRTGTTMTRAEWDALNP